MNPDALCVSEDCGRLGAPTESAKVCGSGHRKWSGQGFEGLPADLSAFGEALQVGRACTGAGTAASCCESCLSALKAGGAQPLGGLPPSAFGALQIDEFSACWEAIVFVVPSLHSLERPVSDRGPALKSKSAIRGKFMFRAKIRSKRPSCIGLISAALVFSFYPVLSLTVVVEAADRSQSLALKPGLWEVITIDGDDGLPVPASILEKLTPQQRARLQERMKARSPDEGIAIVVKQCLTSQQLRTGVPFLPYRSCSRTMLRSAGGSFTLGTQCRDRTLKLEGTVRIEVIDATTVRGDWRLHAEPEDVTRDWLHRFLAVWKAPDCGPS